MTAPSALEACSHRPSTAFEARLPWWTLKSDPRETDGSTSPNVGKLPLAHDDENCCLRDRVGIEVMKLDPIVIRKSPHKPTRRDPKPLVVKCEEAHHVARRRVGLPRIHRGRGTIHSGNPMSTRGQRRPPSMRSSSASRITVETGHASGMPGAEEGPI